MNEKNYELKEDISCPPLQLWDVGGFKTALNNLMIMYGPENLTIGKAEKIMINFVGKLNQEANKGE